MKANENRANTRHKLLRDILRLTEIMDIRQLLKLYAFAHRMVRDKLK